MSPGIHSSFLTELVHVFWEEHVTTVVFKGLVLQERCTADSANPYMCSPGDVIVITTRAGPKQLMQYLFNDFRPLG